MQQPPLITPSSVELANAERRSLRNGMALYTLAANDFEVLRVTFVFHAGSATQTAPFSASATANLLAEGSQNLTAQQIAEQLDYYGSWYDVSLDRDYAYISVCMLSKFLEPTLAVASEFLLRPVFPETELRTYCAKRKQQLAISRMEVDVQAREAFARTLFGAEHPYGISSEEGAYDMLQRANLIDFYNSHYTADNGFVVCSGRIGEAELQAVTTLAEQFPRGVFTPVAFPAPETKHSEFVAHPGAVQSSIRIGRLLFTRRHPDFTGMQVLATVLGGYFGSRLMQNLREEHGYTYGAMSAMVNFEQAGYLSIATQVGTDITQDALRQIHNEIERLRTEMMSEEELSLVKNMMVGETMRILDGPFGIADVAIENILCGTDNSVIGDNLRRIGAMSPADIRRLAEKYLAPEDLTTVVVGENSADSKLQETVLSL